MVALMTVELSTDVLVTLGVGPEPPLKDICASSPKPVPSIVALIDIDRFAVLGDRLVTVSGIGPRETVRSTALPAATEAPAAGF
jgi:hypothetical protein